MISFLNRRVLRSRVLGRRICPFLFESTTDRFPIVTHALTQNATGQHEFGSLDRRATVALTALPLPWSRVQGCTRRAAQGMDHASGQLRVEVERVVLVSDDAAKQPHHEYEMRVTIGARSWTVRHRYREFDAPRMSAA